MACRGKIARGWLHFAVVAAAFAPSLLTAEMVRLVPSQDNTLYENPKGDTSNGQGWSLIVGRTQSSANYRRRGLLAFDIDSALPGDALIESASLSFSVTRVGGLDPPAVELTAHRVLSAWGEGDSHAGETGGQGAPSQTGDATWLHTFFDESTWTTPGGDFATSASGSVTVVGLDRYTIPSTPASVADVQSWLGNPDQNFGWLLKTAEDQTGSTKVVASRNHPEAQLRPELLITYSLPAIDVPGDTDGDQDVDLEDLNKVRNHFGASGSPVPGDTAPFDGQVDLVDLNNVRNHFGNIAAAPVVPEPGTLALCFMALCMQVALHCRKCRGATKTSVH